MDLFLLGHTCINKNYTRPYKLSRVRPDRAVLWEREPSTLQRCVYVLELIDFCPVLMTLNLNP